MTAAQKSGSLQVAGRGSLQSAVGHDANLTNRSKSRRQNNNVEIISEYVLEADFDQNDFSGLKAEQKVFEKSGLKKQPHRRRSRTDSKIAFLQRGRRGRRGKSSSPQHRYSPHQSFSFAAPSEFPEPADGEYPAASHPENQQLLPNAQANPIAQPNTQLQPAPQLQTTPTPSPHLPVALCHYSNARINDLSGSPYDLPTSCPPCQRARVYRPSEEKPPPTPKTKRSIPPSAARSTTGGPSSLDINHRDQSQTVDGVSAYSHGQGAEAAWWGRAGKGAGRRLRRSRQR
ncbi:hypothetical protein HO133_003740 [Letharia lupina]|uniref:Uncharacterized protein n=1 Tax=Letharia lupina TaxID=560253 RepID=A0A8H6CAB3_9LECA|nr:uncharacterized protein HO133_003740 [Letharia lupina]KAF6219915.1 hypothetical protein HO133_003740 [Letharia lupina]